MNILYIYRQNSWNCFWYIMFSLILQCCISFLVTLLPAYLKGTVWLWILQKQMYKRSCTMSQMWRPRRLGTSTNWQTWQSIPFLMFQLCREYWVHLPLREERWKKWKKRKDMWWTNYTIFICGSVQFRRALQKGPSKFCLDCDFQNSQIPQCS